MKHVFYMGSLVLYPGWRWQIKSENTLYSLGSGCPTTTGSIVYPLQRFNTSFCSKQLTTEQQQYLQDKYEIYMASVEPYLYQVISNPGFPESIYAFKELL